MFRSGNAREYQALTANPAPVPTASREFRRTERLLVRFDAYAPGHARCRWSPPGCSTAPATRWWTCRCGRRRAPASFYQLDLPLAGFAAGEYLIEVKAKGAEGEAMELVPLKITS